MRRLSRHFLLVQHLFLRESESSPGTCVGNPLSEICILYHTVCLFSHSTRLGKMLKKRQPCIPFFLFSLFFSFCYDLYVINWTQCKWKGHVLHFEFLVCRDVIPDENSQSRATCSIMKPRAAPLAQCYLNTRTCTKLLLFFKRHRLFVSVSQYHACTCIVQSAPWRMSRFNDHKRKAGVL